jgi:glycerol kinase
MPELVLAIDVGTTTARAAVVAPEGRMLGLAASPLVTRSPAPGLAEQDAEALWRAAREVIDRAMAAADVEGADLAAVGVTTQRASAVAWRRGDGRAVTPVALWSDLRGAGRAAELQARGHLLSPQQPATKLEAIVRDAGHPPRELAWGNVDSWLLWKLSGGTAHVTDRSQAWPTGYLGFADLEWNRALIAEQGLDELAFPRLVDTRGPMALADPRVLGAPVPITADVADQQGALIAHGEAPGVAKITWGTSGTFDLFTGPPVFAGLPGLPPLVVSSVAGESRFCLEGMILSAGSAIDWLARMLDVGSAAYLVGLAAEAEDSGGVAFLPALQGLGAPHGQSDRLGRLAGLSAAADRAHIARAALEGLAFRAREILDRAAAVGGLASDAPIGVDGGLTRSDLFVQILADLTGHPIRPLANPEATLMGAALLAARGAALLDEAALRAALAPRLTLHPRLTPDESQARFTRWLTAVHGP